MSVWCKKNNLLKAVAIPSPITGLVLRQPPRDSVLPNPGILVQVNDGLGHLESKSRTIKALVKTEFLRFPETKLTYLLGVARKASG